MKIRITPIILAAHCPEFTLSACEAICDYCEEFGLENFSFGDISILFGETEEEFYDGEEENLIAKTDCGTVVYTY